MTVVFVFFFILNLPYKYGDLLQWYITCAAVVLRASHTERAQQVPVLLIAAWGKGGGRCLDISEL